MKLLVIFVRMSVTPKVNTFKNIKLIPKGKFSQVSLGSLEFLIQMN